MAELIETRANAAAFESWCQDHNVHVGADSFRPALTAAIENTVRFYLIGLAEVLEALQPNEEAAAQKAGARDPARMALALAKGVQFSAFGQGAEGAVRWTLEDVIRSLRDQTPGKPTALAIAVKAALAAAEVADFPASDAAAFDISSRREPNV